MSRVKEIHSRPAFNWLWQRETWFSSHLSKWHSLRPSEIFLFLRSFLRSAAGCSPAAFFQRRGNEKLFKTSPRAMATCTRERERERKVIRQSNRSERRFNQANGKLEAECCPFFFPLERIQVDYALDSISFQRFRWFPRRCFSAPNIGAARGERYAWYAGKKGRYKWTRSKTSQDFF